MFAERLLAQVNDRIRLFNNVFWWFILPIIGVGDFGFRFYVAWWVGAVTGGTQEAVGTVVRASVETAVLGVGVFYLFRWIIKRDLQPRKQALEELIQSLSSPGAE